MEEVINLEKREKLKKGLLIIAVISTLGLFTNFDKIVSLLEPKKEEPKQETQSMMIDYDSDGYINKIKNNGKVYKFEKGRLL